MVHHHAQGHRHFAKRQDDDDNVVYVTAKPTFRGPIGGFSTAGPKPTAVASPSQRTRGRPTTSRPRPTPSSSLRRTTSAKTSRSSSSDTAEPTTGTTDFDFTPTNVNRLPASTTGSSISSSAPEEAAVGLSGGGKAGLAIGVIALVAIIAGAVLFYIRKKRALDAQMDEVVQEKPFVGAGVPAVKPPTPEPAPAPVSTPSTAPRLDVRHMSQFSPNLDGGHGSGAPGFAAGAALGAGAAAAAAGAARNLTGNQAPGHQKGSGSNGSNGSNPFNDPVNPFENGSAPAVAPVAREVSTPSPEMIAAPPTSGKAHPPAPMQPPAPGFAKDGTPGSPMGSDSASIVSVAPAGAAGPAMPNNVHRVQLDFNPSMDDEIELRAGQLVRLVHEYDDGWALCVRLDRSQQGVAPRTCLSARPVKPRPRGPQGPGSGPRGPPAGPPPNGRPRTPTGGRGSPGPGPHPNGPPRYPQQNSRPSSPAGGYRPYPPPVQANGMPFPPSHGNGMQPPARIRDIPRSLSPGPGNRVPMQPQSMSPGPRGPTGLDKPTIPAAQRQRSNSTGPAGHNPGAPAPGPSALGGPVQVASEIPTQQAPKAPEPQQLPKAPEPAPTSEPPAPAIEQSTPPQAAPTSQESVPQPTAKPTQSPTISLGPVGRKPVPGQSQ